MKNEEHNADQNREKKHN